jgi:hypothetical protein
VTGGERETIMTGEEWDTHWGRIYDDARAAGEDVDTACELADDEAEEQFGARPEDVAS